VADEDGGPFNGRENVVLSPISRAVFPALSGSRMRLWLMGLVFVALAAAGCGGGSGKSSVREDGSLEEPTNKVVPKDAGADKKVKPVK
jgi:hypothetical protein